MTLIFERDLVESACQISRSMVISFENYCPDAHTRRSSLPGPLKWSVEIQRSLQYIGRI